MTTQAKRRRHTTMVPVTTMEELPLLDAKERALLVKTLEHAQAEVRAGKATDYEPKRFRDRLVRIYRGKKP